LRKKKRQFAWKFVEKKEKKREKEKERVDASLYL